MNLSNGTAKKNSNFYYNPSHYNTKMAICKFSHAPLWAIENNGTMVQWCQSMSWERGRKNRLFVQRSEGTCLVVFGKVPEGPIFTVLLLLWVCFLILFLHRENPAYHGEAQFIVVTLTFSVDQAYCCIVMPVNQVHHSIVWFYSKRDLACKNELPLLFCTAMVVLHLAR